MSQSNSTASSRHPQPDRGSLLDSLGFSNIDDFDLLDEPGLDLSLVADLSVDDYQKSDDPAATECKVLEGKPIESSIQTANESLGETFRTEEETTESLNDSEVNEDRHSPSKKEEESDASPAIQEDLIELDTSKESTPAIPQTIEVRCPACGEQLSLKPEHLGIEGACIFCDLPIKAEQFDNGEIGVVRISEENPIEKSESSFEIYDNKEATSMLSPLFQESPSLDQAMGDAPHDSISNDDIDPNLFTSVDEGDSVFEPDFEVFEDEDSKTEVDFGFSDPKDEDDVSGATDEKMDENRFESDFLFAPKSEEPSNEIQEEPVERVDETDSAPFGSSEGASEQPFGSDTEIDPKTEESLSDEPLFLPLGNHEEASEEPDSSTETTFLNDLPKASNLFDLETKASVPGEHDEDSQFGFNSEIPTETESEIQSTASDSEFGEADTTEVEEEDNEGLFNSQPLLSSSEPTPSPFSELITSSIHNNDEPEVENEVESSNLFDSSNHSDPSPSIQESDSEACEPLFSSTPLFGSDSENDGNDDHQEDTSSQSIFSQEKATPPPLPSKREKLNQDDGSGQKLISGTKRLSNGAVILLLVLVGSISGAGMAAFFVPVNDYTGNHQITSEATISVKPDYKR